MQRAMTNANQTSRDTHIHGTGHIQTGTGYTALAYSRYQHDSIEWFINHIQHMYLSVCVVSLYEIRSQNPYRCRDTAAIVFRSLFSL